MKNWFVVDKEGLAQLQKGKSKTFIVNELVQNAWDENITLSGIRFKYDIDNKLLTITVRDDSPEGFKNITHAYTLFADTYKRRDATKRGRFNLGEKQVIAICKTATVKTTKGTIVFDDTGRHELPEKTEKGSLITVTLNATLDEYNELREHAKKLIVPKDIVYTVDGVEIPYKPPFKTFNAILDTEVLKGDAMLLSTRKTTINLITPTDDKSYIYEMGIPIMEIDCPWHIDVQQKIPLAVDRQTVQRYFIQDVFAEILNNVYNDLTTKQSSEVWVRTAMKDKRITKEATKQVLQLRFGNKLLVGNSFDPNANDEALAHGYNVISGNIMSKEEWNTIRGFDLVQSTSDMFGHTGIAEAKPVKPTSAQKNFAKFVKRVAKEFLKIDITVKFVSVKGTNTIADYGNRELRFNVAHSRIYNGFFDKLTPENIDLMVHELGHEDGNHTEHDYHALLTKLSANLVIKALNNPEFFEVN